MVVKVSVAIGVRNRKKNIIKCIKSLINQTLSKKYFELVITDYGGTDDLEKSIKPFYSELNIKYIFVKTSLPWNEARAKNISIKNSSHSFIICTNADIIFEKNVLKRMMDIVDNNKKEYIYLVNRWDILENKKIVLSLKSHIGDFQGFHKKNWLGVRGYDESMTGWGELDGDLRLRFKRVLDKDEFWLDENHIKIFHTYHEPKFNMHDLRLNWWKSKLNHFIKVNNPYFGDKENISKTPVIKNIYLFARVSNFIYNFFNRIYLFINKSINNHLKKLYK
ncbi:MAG: glycosyltransferase [Candidatus Nanoarchaeia archaeon]|nr:glycosyltransferase [Candidatus Nanoarchaeia archaeon]MDD5499835.1 glycosyltransferase [Candidatus Nanoarchaeia archaeon]